ncbi:MAG: VPS10 domain-containing protein, partial [Acidimicrobiales bacterium]
MAKPENVAEPVPRQSPLQTVVAGLELRSVGPAFMGGRIADIAVDPSRPSTWYVAAGSGGVWRTKNAGITWDPVFDDQGSYSIGCVRIDPSRPDVIWVGTGEAVSGRHVGWGDGVYRSDDAGKSWTCMGLERSEHISDILIDPRNSDVVYVAAEGPLWSAGGERGLFKTSDSGETWDAILTVDDDTGVTSAAFAPDDPDTIYAATYQRRRRVWSFLAGGPGSGIHISTDAGETWQRITRGLPEGDMGRIGLAVTPAAPEIVYATIEAAEKDERGFYRSTDRGRSWERRNEYLSSGTGPHYYQEIFASPTDPDRVYQVDVFLHVTADGGTTFRNLEDGKHKHSDNHVVWIDPADRLHLLVGTDAGLYESFDDGGSWRHVSNLPISQFYRVAVDNSAPFTHVLGGAQDLGTVYGPLQTGHVDGVRNQDWSVPLGADGYHVAFDPDDPDVCYLEWQVGNVMRLDRRCMELVDIQPQPGPDDPPERWNWDTPIEISPHDSSRIYVASQRVWRSDDRGDSWTPVSPDLTTDPNRYELPVGERMASVDSLYDHEAMSLYGTVSALSESPIEPGRIYAGTDDGRLHAGDREGSGVSWRLANRPSDLPERAYINDVKASLHNAASVFLVADDHKSGDYSPYLYESTDRGSTWRSMSGGLPTNTIVWVIEQDHADPNLLFVGAEHGLFASHDRGESWLQVTGGLPTVAFRDLAIQRRDDDLVAASFGRGLYVLDDYSPLREHDDDDKTAMLFPVRDAWWHVRHEPMQAKGQPTLGSTAFRASNPPFGATFTYRIRDEFRTGRAERRIAERTMEQEGSDVPFPGWDQLWTEHLESEPIVWLVVRNAHEEPIRLIEAEQLPGLHRSAWDLRYSPPQAVTLETPEFEPPWAADRRGPLV